MGIWQENNFSPMKMAFTKKNIHGRYWTKRTKVQTKELIKDALSVVRLHDPAQDTVADKAFIKFLIRLSVAAYKDTEKEEAIAAIAANLTGNFEEAKLQITDPDCEQYCYTLADGRYVYTQLSIVGYEDNSTTPILERYTECMSYEEEIDEDFRKYVATTFSHTVEEFELNYSEAEKKQLCCELLFEEHA